MKVSFSLYSSKLNWLWTGRALVKLSPIIIIMNSISFQESPLRASLAIDHLASNVQSWTPPPPPYVTLKPFFLCSPKLTQNDAILATVNISTWGLSPLSAFQNLLVVEERTTCMNWKYGWNSVFVYLWKSHQRKDRRIN